METSSSHRDFQLYALYSFGIAVVVYYVVFVVIPYAISIYEIKSSTSEVLTSLERNSECKKAELECLFDEIETLRTTRASFKEKATDETRALNTKRYALKIPNSRNIRAKLGSRVDSKYSCDDSHTYRSSGSKENLCPSDACIKSSPRVSNSIRRSSPGPVVKPKESTIHHNVQVHALESNQERRALIEKQDAAYMNAVLVDSYRAAQLRPGGSDSANTPVVNTIDAGEKKASDDSVCKVEVELAPEPPENADDIITLMFRLQENVAGDVSRTPSRSSKKYVFSRRFFKRDTVGHVLQFIKSTEYSVSENFEVIRYYPMLTLQHNMKDKTIEELDISDKTLFVVRVMDI